MRHGTERQKEREEKKKEEEREKERALNILFQSVSKNEENTRRDSKDALPQSRCCCRLGHWADTRDIHFPKHTDSVFAET